MFDKFKQLFSGESLLDEAFNKTVEMIEYDHEMYIASRKTLRESDTDQLPFDIRKMDRRINRYERQVRRHVLTHLTIAGTANLLPGLALVSVVIDVERIGDYTKNIVDLATKHKKPLKAGDLEPALAQIERVNDEIFPKVIEVMKHQDADLARSVMDQEKDTAAKSEDVISRTLTETIPGLTCSNTVCVAMYARFLKRINAHLTNIASSVVNPFPRISFREKRLRE